MKLRPKPDKNRTPEEQYWIEVGRGFGYPECCVNFFCDSVVPHIAMTNLPYYGTSEAVMKEPWYGTGFVPCPVCRIAMNLDPEHYIAEIIAPRRLRDYKPFPDSGFDCTTGSYD